MEKSHFRWTTFRGAGHFIDDVQKKIDDSKKNVQLHNLSRCYVSNGAASTCYADIPDTPYRMIGFPSYSYKNREPGSDSNSSLQEKQFETFRSLLDAARQAGKRVLILTHIPLIDDPYTLAQDRYAGVSSPAAIDKDPKNMRSVWSTWNVSKKLADEWEEAVASDSVAAVLAGHLHDSHKEVYQRPYLWSTTNDRKTGFSKLYMAPPLSVKNQDASPLQARGFSLVGLDPDRIEYRVHWYDAQTGNFTADRFAKPQERKGPGRWSWGDSITATVIRCFASFGQFACPKSLDQWTIFFIALLAAFLTVVQVWKIPEPENPLIGKAQASSTPGGSGAGQTGANQNAGTQTPGTTSAFDPSPFASNLGKTVITGLGGLAAAAVVKSLDGSSNPTDNKFYIAWFIVLFFTLLLIGAAWRSIAEALRERVTITHPKLDHPPCPIWPTEESWGFWRSLTYWLLRVNDWVGFWFLRLWHWLLSLRSTLLTLLDTFLNLIQGKNQTLTRYFSNAIIQQQRNMICVADVIRRHLNEVLLQSTRLKDSDLKPRDVRVNISVLSLDQSNVFYIARTPGSAPRAFPKRSVAWVSVFTGSIRWFKKTYSEKSKDIILLDNQKGVIAGDEVTITLYSNYQERAQDYEAFVLFPFPWPVRGHGGRKVRGAIHISFRRLSDFETMWTSLTDDQQADKEGIAKEMDPLIEAAATEEKRNELQKQKEDRMKAIVVAGDRVDDVFRGRHIYESEEKMLDDWCKDIEFRAALREAIDVLGNLLCGFNEDIYLSSKKTDDCCEG